jgi:hypothetical protein
MANYYIKRTSREVPSGMLSVKATIELEGKSEDVSGPWSNSERAAVDGFCRVAGSYLALRGGAPGAVVKHVCLAKSADPLIEDVDHQDTEGVFYNEVSSGVETRVKPVIRRRLGVVVL